MGLFSTRTVEHHTTLVPYEKTVHEHRAPTDQSVRLLAEMQQKAQDSVVAMVQTDFNGLKCIVASFYDRFDTKIRIRYDLNGINRDFTATLRHMDFMGRQERRETIMADIRTQFAEHLALEMLHDFVPQMLPVLQQVER